MREEIARLSDTARSYSKNFEGTDTREALGSIEADAWKKARKLGIPIEGGLEFYQTLIEPHESPVFQQPKLQAVTRPIVEKIFAREVPRWENSAKDVPLERWLLNAIADHGPIKFSEGFTLSLRRKAEAEKKDTPGQEYAFVTHWDVSPMNEAARLQQSRPVWDGRKAVEQLTPAQQIAYEELIAKIKKAGFIRQADESEDANPQVWMVTMFPAKPTEEKSTKFRTVFNLILFNLHGKDVSNTQMSRDEAITLLRAMLPKGGTLITRDLSNAFLHVEVDISEVSSNGEGVEPTRRPVKVRIQSHKGRFDTDRLLFGHSVGPLALTCCQQILRYISDRVIEYEGFDLSKTGSIDVMDDLMFAGEEAPTLRAEVLMDSLWAATGFEAPASKRIVFGDMPARWLGVMLRWDGSELHIEKPDHPVGELGLVTKRRIYEVAGHFTSITGSIPEALSIAHANVMRMIAGQYPDWDSPLDERLVGPILWHYERAKKLWAQGKEEVLSLLGDLTTIIVQTDASLSGYGCVFLDGETRKDIFAKAKVAFATMTEESWQANRMEILAILFALRKLCERLMCYKKLRLVRLETDSYVAAASCDRYIRPQGSNIEQLPIRRSRSAIHGILFDLERFGVQVMVSHIPGESNVIADALSRVAETGGHRNIVFGSKVDKANNYNSGRLKQAKKERHQKQQRDTEASEQSSGEYLDETDSEQIEKKTKISVRRVREKPTFFRPGPDVKSIPSLQRFLAAFFVFANFRARTTGVPLPPENDAVRQFFAMEQRKDEYCNKLIEEVKEKKSAIPFELHGGGEGVLVLREAVREKDLDTGVYKQILRVVLPHGLASEFMQMIHCDGGHKGILQTEYVCGQVMYCKGMKDLLRRTLEQCEYCLQAKGHGLRSVDHGAIQMPSGYSRKFGVDIFGGLMDPQLTGTDAPMSEASKVFLLSVHDCLSNWTVIKRLPDLKAETVAMFTRVAFREVGAEGYVQEIVSDNGVQFTAEHFKALLTMYPGLIHRRIPAYTPYLGGSYEIAHRSAVRSIITELLGSPTEQLEEAISVAMWSINTYRPSGYPSPWCLRHGSEPATRADRLKGVILGGANQDTDNEAPFTSEQAKLRAKEVGARVEALEDVCKSHFREARLEELIKRGPKRGESLREGDRVGIRQHSGGKFSSRWRGPFVVKEVFDSMVTLVDQDRPVALVHVKKWDGNRASQEEASEGSEPEFGLVQSRLIDPEVPPLKPTLRSNRPGNQKRKRAEFGEFGEEIRFDNGEAPADLFRLSRYGRTLRPTEKMARKE